jgi:hypothetical protein
MDLESDQKIVFTLQQQHFITKKRAKANSAQEKGKGRASTLDRKKSLHKKERKMWLSPGTGLQYRLDCLDMIAQLRFLLGPL